MLKFTYTETGFHLERLVESVETIVARRAILSVRTGDRVVIEPSNGSFLLPADVPTLPHLLETIRRDKTGTVEFCKADENDIEIVLEGVWLAEDADREEGIFLANVSDRLESLLFFCWREALFSASFVSDLGE